jgi:HEPN domain-containing protein
VLLRGEVHLVLVPLTEGTTVVRLIDQIDGLPEEVGATLSREEFEAIGRKAAGATISFQKLYNLTVEDGFLDAVERGLVWRALFDLETAATTLRHVGDTQNTIFQIHQAAEKFLKVALKRSGSTADLKRFGHNLPAVFEELKKFSGRYSWLEPCVVALQAFAPNMEIRYSVVPRRVEEAIEAFHAALSICWRPCANVALRYEAGFGPLSFLTGVFLRGWDSGEIFLQGQPSERSAHSGIDAFRDISGSRSDDVRHFGQFLGERFVPGGEEPR